MIIVVEVYWISSPRLAPLVSGGCGQGGVGSGFCWCYVNSGRGDVLDDLMVEVYWISSPRVPAHFSPRPEPLS